MQDFAPFDLHIIIHKFKPFLIFWLIVFNLTFFYSLICLHINTLLTLLFYVNKDKHKQEKEGRETDHMGQAAM